MRSGPEANTLTSGADHRETDQKPTVLERSRFLPADAVVSQFEIYGRYSKIAQMMPIKKKAPTRLSVPTPTKTLASVMTPSLKEAIPLKITKPITQTVRASRKKKSDDFMARASTLAKLTAKH
jgi:hypothetical protein